MCVCVRIWSDATTKEYQLSEGLGEKNVLHTTKRVRENEKHVILIESKLGGINSDELIFTI